MQSIARLLDRTHSKNSCFFSVRVDAISVLRAVNACQKAARVQLRASDHAS